MAYRILITKTAKKQLDKLEQTVKIKLHSYLLTLDKHSPRNEGKPLSQRLNLYWRYRVGNYRIIALIDDDIKIISIIKVGHRKDIYQDKS